MDKPTKEEAGEKFDRLPEDEKQEFIKEFGIMAKPLFISFAVQYGFTELGNNL